MKRYWYCVDFDGVEIFCTKDSGKHFTMNENKNLTYEQHIYDAWLFCQEMNKIENEIENSKA